MCLAGEVEVHEDVEGHGVAHPGTHVVLRVHCRHLVVVARVHLHKMYRARDILDLDWVAISLFGRGCRNLSGFGRD